MLKNFLRKNFIVTIFISILFLPSLSDANLSSSSNPDNNSQGFFGNRWLYYGGELNNNHHLKGLGSLYLNKSNSRTLQLEWEYITEGPISIPASTIEGVLYLTDQSGGVHAVNSKTGKALWRINLKNSPYSTPGKYFSFSRNTPAIYGDYLLFGNQHALFGNDAFYTPNTGILVSSKTPPFIYEFDLLNPKNVLANGAYLMIINRHTGALVAKLKLDDHPLAMVTQNPVIYNNKVFIGISTQESLIAGFNPAALYGLDKDQIKPYPCCTFEGKVVAVDIIDPKTPKLLWTSYTVKPFLVNGKPATLKQRLQNIPLLYSGVSVWGGMPTIDPEKGLVIVGTGNNHHSPDSVVQCIINQQGNPTGCSSPDNHVSSIIGLRIEDGSKAWTQSYAVSKVAAYPEYDTWNVSCGGVPQFEVYRDWQEENCPGGLANPVPGPDLDFGQGPMLSSFKRILYSPPSFPFLKEISAVLIGQKSGIFYALDVENGKKIWSTEVGPGGKDGGFQWNAATDGKRIYGSIANSAHMPWNLINPAKDSSVKTATTGGFWSALDIRTGKIIWQTTGKETNPNDNENHGPPLIVGKDLMFVGSYSGFIRLFDTARGLQLWSFDTANTSIGRSKVNSHPTVIKNSIYWGIGYSGDQKGALLKFSPKASITNQENDGQE